MATPPRDEDRPSHGVTIGLREIYDEVVRIATQITHLSLLVTTLEHKQNGADTDVGDLENRVRELEKKPVVTPIAMWTGIGVLIAAAGVVVTIIIALTGK